MKSIKSRTFIITAALLLLPLTIFAGTITYQGRVQDTAGLDIDGAVTAGLRIYDTAAGSTVLWSETQSVTASRGIISVELGAVDPLPEGLFSNPDLYLGITVAGDAEMAPRKRLVSTWKAISADKASGKSVQAGGGTLSVSGTSTASASITFPKAFSQPPVVMLGAPADQVGGADFIPSRVTDVTTTGCVAHFDSLDGSTASGSTGFDWIAIGE